nr:immunoglobulin domain-containing protein [Chitinophagales bacterium]
MRGFLFSFLFSLMCFSAQAQVSEVLCEGIVDTLSFTPVAGATSYSWTKNGQPIVGSSFFLFFNEVMSSDAGTYIRTANPGGETTTFSVTVQTKPTITTQPMSASLYTGERYTLSIVPSNYSQVQWFFENSSTPTNASENYTIPSFSSTFAGDYHAKVFFNGACSNRHIRSNDATLTLNLCPKFTQPLPSVVRACVGDSFQIVLTGENLTNPNTQITWYKDGKAIPFQIFRTYNVVRTSNQDSGLYYADVKSSSCPTIASTVTRVVLSRMPEIIVQPSDAVRPCDGIGATLKVVANYSGAFQWFNNDIPILNATNPEYKITALSRTGYNKFYVKINGNPPCGAIASDTVFLRLFDTTNIQTLKHPSTSQFNLKPICEDKQGFLYYGLNDSTSYLGIKRRNNFVYTPTINVTSDEVFIPASFRNNYNGHVFGSRYINIFSDSVAKLPIEVKFTLDNQDSLNLEVYRNYLFSLAAQENARIQFGNFGYQMFMISNNRVFSNNYLKSIDFPFPFNYSFNSTASYKQRVGFKEVNLVGVSIKDGSIVNAISYKWTPSNSISESNELDFVVLINNIVSDQKLNLSIKEYLKQGQIQVFDMMGKLIVSKELLHIYPQDIQIDLS